MNKINSQLAVRGGKAIRKTSWPIWPQGDRTTQKFLIDVLNSGRWGIGGKYNGKKLFEQRFAHAFARFHASAFCVPVVNGSAALAVALEALGVTFGDEVIVPGLAWISCATAVIKIGAIPILVDIDPETLCISPSAARLAINNQTKAIIVIHSYCTVADLDALVALSKETGIPIIEDCSQAHGAIWKGQRVGTFGKIGVYSMGNSKVLTCGEGGVAITNDPKIYECMQQLRGDGYRYKDSKPVLGQSQLEESGMVQGYNYCLSEFQAAVLLSGLKTLNRQNKKREENGEYLKKLCSDIDGVQPLYRYAAVNHLTYFRFCIRLNLEEFGSATIDQIRRALIAELNESSIELVDYPLTKNPLYKPLNSPAAYSSIVHRNRLDPLRFNLPIALQAHKECITFHHAMLLGSKRDIEDIATSIRKLKANSKELAYV